MENLPKVQRPVDLKKTKTDKLDASIFFEKCCSFIDMLRWLFLALVVTGNFCTVRCQTQLSPVFAAIRNNNLKELSSMLDRGTDPNSSDEDGDNLLMYAALYSSVDCMKLLLDRGSDPNKTDHVQETALMWALDDTAKMKLLIAHGADVNARTRSGNTPLLIAAVGNGKYEVIKLLLDHGADPFAVNNKKQNALIRAAAYSDTATISLLLSKGIDINAGDRDTLTALLSSIVGVNRLVTLQLLERGADPDLVGLIGLTAVSMVVTFNDLESVRAVLKKAKNINTQDNDGHSALMWAVYNEHDNIDIINALLERGAEINAKAKDGATALSWALKKGAHTGTVELLKKHGAK